MLPNRVKHGMTVTVPVVGPLVDWQRNPIEDHSGTWEVLDRAPGGATSWWIHRHNAAGRWESVKVDAEMLEEQEARIEWDATAPLNAKVRAGSYSIHTSSGYTNVTGYVSGEYGVHNRGRLYSGWTVTHIPTGRSLPAELFTMPEAKALLARLGELDSVFPGATFGDKPSDREGLNTLKAIIKPELVNA